MLTDAQCKAAKPREAAYKLVDSAQLFLHVTPAGGRHWRMNYTFGKNAAGKPAQKTLTFGPYPALTLLAARAKRDEAKAMIRDGRDPAVEKKITAKTRAIEGGNTFEIIARRWFELRSPTWSTVHAADVLRSLETDVFSSIGDLPLGKIESPKVLELLNAIEQRGAIETAHRVRQRISDIFVYAISIGVAKTDPAASLGKALRKKPRAKKQPSVIDRIRDYDDQVKAVQTMLANCEAERCRAATKFALRLLALTAVRPNEIQNAAWVELEGLDGPEPVWRIPATRMKGNQDKKAEEDGDHVVPLSTHAVEVIQALRPLTGSFKLMFPSERHVHRPISENTLRALLIRAGYYQRHVPHGFRAAFSTIMNQHPDREEGDRAVIDLMLAHVPGNKVEGAYNRAAYMPRRREIAQAWGDLVAADLPDPVTHIGQPIRWADTSPKGPRNEIETTA
ncbi:tyrosine-type recombinase/integrase [Sphingomonas endolithica]|uniref:tyrosine-type recombinase/integrase n=1 Tax=Sphingomonas endolithica TaxID=2972485 RepID=UPI0021B02219|nr:integrase arm-type DNA-binding domain-containing protein [Sphingomonas sp. ZFBP2030]